MRVYYAVASMLLAAMASPSLGGWISGGTGELTGDSANPWFLEIPEQAGKLSYCIEADESAMGVTVAELTGLVDEALIYWRVQLASAHIPIGPGNTRVVVKTGKFNNTNRSCDSSADLAFQFGKLSTAEQREFVKDEGITLKRYIGFAARLAYDQNLRGRGFIYVAPETGDLFPDGEGLLEHFWNRKDENHIRLKATIIHELGHVFGVAHFGGSNDLMGRDFPENVVTNQMPGILYNARLFQPLFRAGNGIRFSRCFETTLPQAIREVFGLSETGRCLQVQLSGDGYSVYSSDDKDLQWSEVAKMTFNDANWRERYHEVVRLWLPEYRTRTVFKDVPKHIKVLSGPAVVETMISGEISSIGPPARRIPAMITVDPLNFQISATVDGKMFGDLFDGATTGWEVPRQSVRR